MKRSMAIFTAKSIKKLSQLSGKGGSNLPGHFARKIDKDILKKIRQNVETLIFITGTNGKTTTSRLVAHILGKKASLIWNREGSNLITGITTAFIDSQSVLKQKKIAYGIIEIDEGSIQQVLKEIRPDYLLGLNLYADQIDRYGSPRELSEKLKQVLNHQSIHFILNANDPYMVNLGYGMANTRYYGLDSHTVESIGTFNDTVQCPNCHGQLKYDLQYFEHIGVFQCDKCHFKTPEIHYFLNEINHNTPLKVNINQENYHTVLSGSFNAYNLLAAVSLCQTLGIASSEIQEGLETVQAPEGRMEQFKIAGKSVLLNLAKNATGVDETLRNLNEKGKKTVCFIFENQAHDGLDVTWIENIDYEILNNYEVDTILVAGALRHEVKAQIEKSETEEHTLKVIDQRERIIEAALATNPEELVVIPNYTAMQTIREAVLKLQ